MLRTTLLHINFLTLGSSYGANLFKEDANLINLLFVKQIGDLVIQLRRSLVLGIVKYITKKAEDFSKTLTYYIISPQMVPLNGLCRKKNY